MYSVLLVVVCLFFSIFAQGETFVLLGDTGKDSEGQRQVAKVISEKCKTETCDQGLLLGDNVYSEGVTSPTDPKLEKVFGQHYRQLPFTFKVALGNHDYGKLSNEWARGQAQVEYSKINKQFELPNFYYGFETENAVFAVLDTTRLMWAKDYQAQALLVKDQHAKAKAENKWFFVMGHHPYLSNGQHGNAGTYDGLIFPPMAAGTDVKRFFDQHVCGKADFYFSGHDHNLQILDANQKSCDLIQVVSGSGASIEDWREKNQAITAHLELGFLLARASAEQVEFEVISNTGKTLFKKPFLKKPVKLPSNLLDESR